MKLEALRKNDLAQIYACFPKMSDDASSNILMTYPNYSNKAFYLTCQGLEQLEKSKERINQGNTNINAIAFWFLAIESFLNALLKIACIVKKEDFKKYKGKDFGRAPSS